MYVRNYLVLLIAGCSVCGLVVFSILGLFFRQETVSASKVSDGALALRDLSGFESGFSQWMVLSDLVIGSDESYLNRGAIKLSDELVATVERLKSGLQDNAIADVVNIERFVMRQRDRLELAASLTSRSRESRLAQLLQEMDNDSPKCIASMESLRANMMAVQQKHSSDYQTLVKYRFTKIAVLLTGFLLVVGLLWLWISQILSKPLSWLTQESQQAKHEGRHISVTSSGPIEIQQLNRSLSDLEVSLREQIEALHRSRSEREQLHHELVDASRKAGMAEVASEVLHNVGNVLNSINVSAASINRQLNESVLSRLGRVNDLIHQRKNELGHFLTHDERGKQLPAAIDLLTRRLQSEHESHREELKLLQHSIEHIRQVIRNQQAFARGSNVIEHVCVQKIVEEAIRINRPAIDSEGIGISLEREGNTQIQSDRHKIQQILINLISNAIHATVANSNNRKPTVKIAIRTQHGSLRIDVIDNGIGIDPDKLTEIFTHGFTTKENGHGFGLHSSAIAAKVLGGSLVVQSNGKGTGALFSLTLPTKPDNANKPLTDRLPVADSTEQDGRQFNLA